MTRVEAWFRRKRLDQELDKELQFHLDQHVRDLVAAGVSADDAKRLARSRSAGSIKSKSESGIPARAPGSTVCGATRGMRCGASDARPALR